MNSILEEWNQTDEGTAIAEMMACCGSRRWAAQMAALRPIANVAALSEAADGAWAAMGESDWLEAFAHHPRIGERNAMAAIGTFQCVVTRRAESAPDLLQKT